MNYFYKTCLSVALMVGAIQPLNSYAFGFPSIPGSSSQESSDGVDASSVDAFVVAGKLSSDMINSAREVIALALETKENRAQLKQQIEQLNGLSVGDKTASEQKKKFNESLDAKIQSTIKSGDYEQQLKSLSKDQLQSVLHSVFNISLGALTQVAQVKQGQNMLGAIAHNPMLLRRSGDIKDSLMMMKDNISGLGSYVTQLPKLFKSLGVSAVIPQNTSSKPMEVPNPAAIF